MTETEKEYKLRCLIIGIIESLEKNTDDFEDLCDCELEEGNHQDLCKTTLMRLDAERWHKEMYKI